MSITPVWIFDAVWSFMCIPRRFRFTWFIFSRVLQVSLKFMLNAMLTCEASPVMHNKALWQIMYLFSAVRGCNKSIPKDQILNSVHCLHAASDMIDDVHIVIVCCFKCRLWLFCTWMGPTFCHHWHGFGEQAVAFTAVCTVWPGDRFSWVFARSQCWMISWSTEYIHTLCWCATWRQKYKLDLQVPMGMSCSVRFSFLSCSYYVLRSTDIYLVSWAKLWYVVYWFIKVLLELHW